LLFFAFGFLYPACQLDFADFSQREVPFLLTCADHNPTIFLLPDPTSFPEIGASMESPATYEDVNLVLRLYELRREDRLRKARAWFAQSFKVRTLDEFNKLCPVGSDENAYFRMVITYWEMTASFITSGVLNQNLFFQSGRELLFVWERVRDVLPQVRENFKDPLAYRNLETVAQSFISWMKTQAPDAYTAFSNRVRGVA
jgi:hypothetical protein